MLLRFQKAAVRGNYETGNQAFSKRLRFLTIRGHAKPAGGKRRRRMSPAARARIGAAKKAWWAKQRGKSGRKKGTAVSKKITGRKPMSAAMRRKLSALM